MRSLTIQHNVCGETVQHLSYCLFHAGSMHTCSVLYYILSADLSFICVHLSHYNKCYHDNRSPISCWSAFRQYQQISDFKVMGQVWRAKFDMCTNICME